MKEFLVEFEVRQIRLSFANYELQNALFRQVTPFSNTLVSGEFMIKSVCVQFM